MTSASQRRTAPRQTGVVRICERGRVNLSTGATDESCGVDIAFSKNAVWEEKCSCEA